MPKPLGNQPTSVSEDAKRLHRLEIAFAVLGVVIVCLLFAGQFAGHH